MSTYEEELARTGQLIYTCSGTSMLPIIRQHRDLLLLRKPEGRLQKFDIALYKRKNGQYILHRIMDVREHDYIFCGDNQYSLEYGITDDQILAVLTGLIRDGRELPMDTLPYRMYVHFWCGCFRLRAPLLRTRRLAGRIKRKLKP